MKLALLIGNRFNPWHFQGYSHLRDRPEITVFYAQSEIQKYFDERNDRAFPFSFERIHFDTERASWNPWARLRNAWREGPPRILPFHERLCGFDLIQSWELFTDWSAEALVARTKYNIPLVVMVWDNIPFNMESYPDRSLAKRQVAAGADRFVVHTERSRRMLDLEGVPEDRIALIPPGVDTDRFAPGPGTRAEFGLSGEDFVILFVGWFLPRKGLDFLIFALRELLRDPALQHRRIRLLAVGSGPGKARIDALIDRLGVRDACTFAGSVPYSRMPGVFRSADAFVLPSIAEPGWQEQFGMALIEAMACGIAVVTTWSGAIPEIVGDAGILCQPNDFLSLYTALRTLILDAPRRSDLAAAGRSRALERFTLDAFAAALLQVYGDVRSSQ